MRSPEEIKKGLEICRGKCTGNKPHCPYDKYVNGCEDTLNRDALAYIQQLEEKTIPKKCTHEATLHRDLTCPVCKNVVSHTVEIFGNKLEAITDYCPFCGQRITTEEIENEVERSSEIWLDALRRGLV